MAREEMNLMPNKAHAVDAPIALVFHIGHRGRRATDAQCSPAHDGPLE
jgi:hypothetical protein